MFHGISIYWKRSILVGITSAIGSIAWFTAFALTQAAYVKTVGQIELLFSIFVTQKIFKEGISRIEIISILFIVSSIVLLIYSTN
jgi:drug/metabolite transporter (DMT)-like permease